MWEPLTIPWAFTACYRDSFAFTFNYTGISLEELRKVKIRNTSRLLV
jgi:hypothetical protein